MIKYSIDYCYKILDISRHYDETIISNNAEEWKKAMEAEIQTWKENYTFELTTVPRGASLIEGRRVYNIKEQDNSQCKFKAIFVAKGYSQIQDHDYRETFSPTARLTSVRFLMQLCAQYDYFVYQMDVKTAYLNALTDYELYLAQPSGYVENDKSVRKLKKSLYGLNSQEEIRILYCIIIFLISILLNVQVIIVFN